MLRTQIPKTFEHGVQGNLALRTIYKVLRAFGNPVRNMSYLFWHRYFAKEMFLVLVDQVQLLNSLNLFDF